MAHTNQTAHYHLPQYVGTDIINPLTDTNKAYEDIDTALYEQGQSVADVVDDIDALKIQNGDSALDTTAQTLSGAINELKNGEDALGLRVTANETDISTLQTQMSTATGNITTLNTSVAGLQTEVASKASATALNNLTTKVGTGNLDTVAQNCVDAINEVKAAIPSGGGSASSISYDGTASGLVATNVQDAIDEVKADIPTIPTSYDADDIVYDNQTSGLTATDVQSAIDELAQSGGSQSLIATATGTTYADQLTSLQTAFNNLSIDKKINSYIKDSDNIYRMFYLATGRYVIPSFGASDGVKTFALEITNAKYYYATNSTTTDSSTQTPPAPLELYA